MQPDTELDVHDSGARVLPFDASRRSRRVASAGSTLSAVANGSDRAIAAVVTVTRFIGGTKVHAQVAVYADDIAGDAESADLKLIPELSELLADGAVEANSYLDRLAATTEARPLADFKAQ